MKRKKGRNIYLPKFFSIATCSIDNNNQKEILALPQTYYHSKKLYQLFKQMDADTYQITDELFFHLMNEGLREEDNGWVLDLGQLKWHTWDKFYYNPRYLFNKTF